MNGYFGSFEGICSANGFIGDIDAIQKFGIEGLTARGIVKNANLVVSFLIS